MKNRLFTTIALFQIGMLLLTPVHDAQALFGIGSFLKDKVGGVLGFLACPTCAIAEAAVEGIAKELKDGVKGFITEEIGVESNDLRQGVQTLKGAPPKVQVKFTATEGKYYTAFAQVEGLTNPQQAYYTWYIKNDSFDRTNLENESDYPESEHMGDVLGSFLTEGVDACGGTGQDECGAQGTDEQKMERYKIAATRANIAAKFDAMRYDSEYNGGNSNDILEADEYSSEVEAGSDDDEDGYLAFVGGEGEFNAVAVERDGGGLRDTDNYCYINNRATGRRFELVEGSIESGFTCGEDDPNDDVGGANAKWKVACVVESIKNCPVPPFPDDLSVDLSSFADGGTANATEDGDPATDPSVTADGGEVSTSVSATNEGVVQLYETQLTQCRIDGQAAECVPDTGDTSRVYCSNGGVPTCVPTKTDDLEAVLEIDRNELRAESCTEVNQYETVFEAVLARQRLAAADDRYDECVEQYLRDCDRDCSDTYSRCGSLQPTQSQLQELEGNLATAIENLLVVYPDGALVDDSGAIVESELNRLLARASSGSDPNSFDCVVDETVTTTREFDCSEFGNCQTETTVSETGETIFSPFAEELGFETAECFPGDSNVPNFAEGDLFPEEYELTNKCTEEIHLFPFSYGSPLVKEEKREDYGIGNPYGFTTGDASFAINEERFWGTNPANAITVEGSVNDEAFITGLGHNQFTWEYQEGDEIGVVVEGTGLQATNHDSPHKPTVFAFMSAGCQPQETSYYSESVRGKNVVFYTANMERADIDSCLLSNFAVPGEVTENNNLTVDITGPQEAIVKNQDYVVSLSADIGNGEEIITDDELSDRAVYNWKFFYSDKTDPTNPNIKWVPYLNIRQVKQINTNGETITSDDQDEINLYNEKLRKMGITEIKGLGLNNMTFAANFTELAFTDEDGDVTVLDKGLIRATVEVNAPTDKVRTTRYGRAEFVMPFISQERAQLRMHRVTTANLPILPLERNDIAQICDDSGRLAGASNANGALSNRETYVADDIACRVLRNEILAFDITPPKNEAGEDIIGGLDVDPEHVHWELDGERIACNSTLAPGLCLSKPPIIFVPTKEAGSIHTVTATIGDPGQGSLSDNVFSRSFFVTEPTVTFAPFDGSVVPQERGTFITTNGEASSDNIDYSNTTFIRNDEVFSLQAEINPRFLQQYAGSDSAITDDSQSRVVIEWEGSTFKEQTFTPIADANGDGDTDDRTGIISANFSVPPVLMEVPVSVDVTAHISTPQPIRQVLTDVYGISQYSSSPSITNAKALIHPQGYSTSAHLSEKQYLAYEAANEKSSRTFTATVFGNTAQYILFILKVALTIGLILFIISLISRPVRRQNP